MPCSLPNELPWSALLEARQVLSAESGGIAFLLRENRWICQPSDSAEFDRAESILVASDDPDVLARTAATTCSTTLYRTDENGLPVLENIRGPKLDPALAVAACVYLPVLLGAAAAKRSGHSFVVGHLTQSLDGRIACENGQSQWIGNEADQHHSHRMRALLDGVMVGATTALKDNPQLTVRHVTGGNPRRIVVSGRGRVIDQGHNLGLMQDLGCEIFTDESLHRSVDNPNVHVSRINATDGHLAPELMLAELRQQNIHSIYLEGGSGTISSFLQAECIDVLQVHIAALILGSGVPSLQLPPIHHIRDAMQVRMHHALLDGHVLLTCRPQITPEQ